MNEGMHERVVNFSEVEFPDHYFLDKEDSIMEIKSIVNSPLQNFFNFCYFVSFESFLPRTLWD